jgi:hypothetical protein
MRVLMLLMFPVYSIAQSKLDSISLLSGKVKILSPRALTNMSDEMWFLKYRNTPRPIMALSDEDGEVNLIANMTQQPATGNQLASYKDYQIEQLKKSRPDLVLLDDGVKTMNGKQVGYFKFETQAIDQKVFNYYFFTIVDGKILLFTFNCIQRLQKKWEGTADQIVASLKVN